MKKCIGQHLHDIDNNVLKSVLQKELFYFVACNVAHFKYKEDICFAHQNGLVTGVCEADCVGHSSVLPDHPDWRLCQSRYCALLKLLLVLGPGSWICKSE